MQSIHDPQDNVQGIYVLTIDRPNGTSLFYIGQTINFHARNADHVRRLVAAQHQCLHLQRAYQKYQNVRFNILEVVADIPSLTSREQHWLDLYITTYGPRNIANEALVASNPMHNPHIRERHRIATLRKSDLWRMKQKVGIRKYKQSEIGRQRTSEMMKRRYADPAYYDRQVARLHDREQDIAYCAARATRMREDNPRSERVMNTPAYRQAQKAGMERLSANPQWQE